MRYPLALLILLSLLFPYQMPEAGPLAAQEAAGASGDHPADMKERLQFIASNPPEDVYLSGYARMDMERLLDIGQRHLGEDAVELMGDLLQEGSRYNRRWDTHTVHDFCEYLKSTFEDTFFFALREGEEDLEAALILEIKDKKRLQKMEKAVVDTQNNSRLKYGVWKYTKELHDCMIKGINTQGEDSEQRVAFTVLEDRYLILATSDQFILDMLPVLKR